MDAKDREPTVAWDLRWEVSNTQKFLQLGLRVRSRG